MYAITADQIDSRHNDDLVDATISDLERALHDDLLLRPERTAGDEIQLLTESPAAALDAALRLTRGGRWAVGVGIGDAAVPLPSSTRAATGSAFFRARDAVERAKNRPERFAVAVEPGRMLAAADVEPLITQTIRLRDRRTAARWALADLLAAGGSRSDAALALGISPQAVAKRYAAAGLRDDEAVRSALVRLLVDADRPA